MKLINTIEKDDKVHNKFWIGEIKDNDVITKWGRLGTKGQSKSYPQGSSWQAESFLRKKIRAKKDKGYKEVCDADFYIARFRAEVISGDKVSACLLVRLMNCCCRRTKEKNPCFGRAEEHQIKIENHVQFDGDLLLEGLIDPASEAADPNYNPIVFVTIVNRGDHKKINLLITPDKSYECQTGESGVRSSTCRRSHGNGWHVRNIKLITNKSDKKLQKICDKATGLIETLL